MNQTFWHELLHACLDRLGEEELSRNEKFIDLLGNALYQAIRTAEFEKK